MIRWLFGLFGVLALAASLSVGFYSTNPTPPPTQTFALPTTRASSPPNASVTAQPTPTQPVLLVDRLPLDRPWFLHNGQVIAFQSGNILQLRTSIYEVIDRHLLPPLFRTRGVPGKFSVLDTITWKRIRVHLVGKDSPQFFVASSNGNYVAFQSNDSDAHGARGVVVTSLNLKTGEAHSLVNPKARQGSPPVEQSVFVQPLVWNGDILHVMEQYSASAFFWQLDQEGTRLSAEPWLIIGAVAWSQGFHVAANGRYMAYFIGSRQPELHLINLENHRDLIVKNGSLYYAVSPDGTRLAFLEYVAANPGTYNLQLYDIQHATQTTLISNVAGINEMIESSRAVAWFDDGQRLLLTVGSRAEILTLAADGKTLDHRTPTAGAHWIVDNDALLVMPKRYEYTMLHHSTLRVQDVRDIPETYWSEIIYIP